MKTIKNLEQLYSLAGAHQVTAQEVINRRIYTDKNGWHNVKFTDEFFEDFAENISQLFGGQNETKRRVKRTVLFSRPQHWGLSRTVIVKYGKHPARWNYITGQDQTHENREIRNFLKR